MNKLKKIIGITLVTTSLLLSSYINPVHKLIITDDNIHTLKDSQGQHLMTIYADAVELENINNYTCINEGNLYVELKKENKYIKVEYTDTTIDIISNTDIELCDKEI